MLVAALALVAAGLGAFFLWTTGYLASRGPADPSGASGTPLARGPADADSGGTADAGTEAAGASRTDGRRDAARPLASRGRIRGTAHVPPGVAFPETWTLEVRPSRYHRPGGAVERSLALSGGERDFELDDLPLGIYEVEPSAEGMNAHAVPVELEPASADVYVVVQMFPAGVLSGQLLFEGGVGADGILLRLRGADGEVFRETRTGISGEYRFEKLPDGEYELTYGDPRNPLFEPQHLSFRAPTMHIPTRIVAGVGQVTFEVVDRLGNPVADVGLAGSGSAGGVVDDVTDDAGRLTIAGLPAGSYRVAATHGDRQRGFETFELNAGEHPIVRIVLE